MHIKRLMTEGLSRRHVKACEVRWAKYREKEANRSRALRGTPSHKIKAARLQEDVVLPDEGLQDEALFNDDTDGTDVAELRAHIVSLTAERDKAIARAETLDELVPPLEEMRREMKGLMLEAQSAMLEAGLPKRQKRDDDIPYYYGANSWQNQADVPWNEAEKRALTPAEGIQILTAQRDEVTRKRKAGN